MRSWRSQGSWAGPRGGVFTGAAAPIDWVMVLPAKFETHRLPLPPSARSYNVETEKQDPNSIFNAYKRLLMLRKSEPALRDGSYEAVNENDPNVFAYLRRSGTSTVLVALNMSGKVQTVAFHLGSKGSSATPLYSSPPAGSGVLQLDHIELAPFGALVASVK